MESGGEPSLTILLDFAALHSKNSDVGVLLFGFLLRFRVY